MECKLLNVFDLVVIDNFDILTVFFEWDFLISTEVLASDSKISAHICDIIVEGPFEISIAIVIHIR